MATQTGIRSSNYNAIYPTNLATGILQVETVSSVDNILLGTFRALQSGTGYSPGDIILYRQIGTDPAQYYNGSTVINPDPSHLGPLASTASSVQITDGTNSVGLLNLTNSKPIPTAIVDANGAQITSFGGGTQYTEGDVDASITGTALMWEDASNTLSSVSVAKPLPINITSSIPLGINSNSSIALGAGITDSKTQRVTLATDNYISTILGAPNFLSQTLLNTSVLNQAAIISNNNSASTLGVEVKNLSATGATLIIEATIDNTTWSPIYGYLSDGIAFSSFTTNRQFRIDTAGRTQIRIRVSSVGVGNATINTALANAPNFVTVTNPTPITASVDDTSTIVLAEGETGSLRATSHRALHVNLRDNAGNEVSIAGGGSSTQYANGTAQASPIGNQVNWNDNGIQRATSNTYPLPTKLTDGTNNLTLLNLTNSKPIPTALVDANGNQITSFGGGVQYTEGETDASITGTAIMWEDATGNTLNSVSNIKPLPVNIITPGDLSTSTLQVGGNQSLNSIDIKIPPQGQAIADYSTPVVLPLSQITSLTPPTSVGINGTLPDFTTPPTVTIGNTTLDVNVISGGGGSTNYQYQNNTFQANAYANQISWSDSGTQRLVSPDQPLPVQQPAGQSFNVNIVSGNNTNYQYVDGTYDNYPYGNQVVFTDTTDNNFITQRIVTQDRGLPIQQAVGQTFNVSDSNGSTSALQQTLNTAIGQKENAATDVAQLVLNSTLDATLVSLLKAVAISSRQNAYNTQAWDTLAIENTVLDLDKLITVPENTTYHVLFGKVVITTTSEVADRTLIIDILNVSGDEVFDKGLYRLVVPFTQPASITRHYNLSNKVTSTPISSASSLGGPNIQICDVEIPPTFILKASQCVRFYLLNGRSGDTLSVYLQVGVR